MFFKIVKSPSRMSKGQRKSMESLSQLQKVDPGESKVRNFHPESQYKFHNKLSMNMFSLLSVQIFYVNKVAVFHAISRDLKHRFMGFPDSRSAQQMIQYMRRVDNLYAARGFRINTVHADPEFEKIREAI